MTNYLDSLVEILNLTYEIDIPYVKSVQSDVGHVVFYDKSVDSPMAVFEKKGNADNFIKIMYFLQNNMKLPNEYTTLTNVLLLDDYRNIIRKHKYVLEIQKIEKLVNKVLEICEDGEWKKLTGFIMKLDDGRYIFCETELTREEFKAYFNIKGKIAKDIGDTEVNDYWKI
jgi:hypothetical protein